jgi:hypothetical protein
MVQTEIPLVMIGNKPLRAMDDMRWLQALNTKNSKLSFSSDHRRNDVAI